MQATRLLNSPQALTRPHPPIMIGGGGEQKTLRLVAQYADATNVFGGPVQIHHKYEVLRRTARTSADRSTRSSARRCRASACPGPRRGSMPRLRPSSSTASASWPTPAPSTSSSAFAAWTNPAASRSSAARSSSRCDRSEAATASADTPRGYPHRARMDDVNDDSTRKEPADADAVRLPTNPLDGAASANGSNPFGGFSIDFSNDIGAVPLANAVGADRLRRGARRRTRVRPSAELGRRLPRDQAPDHRIRTGRAHGRDLRARAPTSNRSCSPAPRRAASS